MKTLKTLLILCFAILSNTITGQDMFSIQKFGVLPTNTPHVNRKNLQKAIDAMSSSGGALYITPVKGGYPVATGIILKKNVSLIGVHGPTGRGTRNESGNGTTGSLFVITDTIKPFITVESATQIRGIQFWYPKQTYDDPHKIIAYKPTICMAKEGIVEGVTLSCLSFYGEYMAMDFRTPGKDFCEQILCEHCYGYPLSGQFIAIDRCYDIPRILHCHVNPANMREFGRSFHKNVIDAVIARHTYSYFIDHTDNAQLMDVFTFGVYGGIYLGKETYGQLTNFNLDCVSIGIYKSGNNQKNRNWMISQGAIIANTGTNLENIHPFVIEGTGHTSITNVEAFSGDNGALTNLGASYDFLTVNGNEPMTIALTGCRMTGYTAINPVTNNNPNAKIHLVNCVDKSGNFIDE
ncbi:MAG: hypothetical protein PHU66_01255 [Bacteroidaceae bacterium]|nr:hypothetical protein [Bacteroidaceae bacterium]